MAVARHNTLEGDGEIEINSSLIQEEDSGMSEDIKSGSKLMWSQSEEVSDEDIMELLWVYNDYYQNYPRRKLYLKLRT